ncbi:transposase [Streptomyces sp. NPDC002758]
MRIPGRATRCSGWATRSTSPSPPPSSGAGCSPCGRGSPHEALARARAERKSDDWKGKHALRAGIEGTINQALGITGMRRARYRGLPKVRLQHAFST